MIEPFLAMQASAGSGKTFALSVRYIALLLSGASVKSITALTFTKKAASEMSERIISTFLNLERKSAELEALCDMLGVSEDEILARRDKVKEEFLQSSLKITTFDAFFNTILRGFSLNLGISPDFKNASDLTALSQKEFVKSVAKNPALLDALARYIAESQKSKNNFFDVIQAFYENFRELRAPSFSDAAAKDEALKIIAGLKARALQKGADEKLAGQFEAKSIDDVLKKAFLPRESLNYKTFSKIYEPAMDEEFAALKDALYRYAKDREARELGELGGFLKAYKSVLSALNARLNELSFADVTRLTRELPVSADKEMLYFRLDARITHLLIDEFQDTNVAQYEIMYPLIEEIVAGYGQNGLGSFFYVGDVKQSIYRFRGGKKELFDKLQRDFSQIKRLSLTHNYRSAKNIVRFVNLVFAPKIDGYVAQIPASREEGYVKIVQNDDVIAACADEVKALVDAGVPSEDIAVLCWKNDDTRAICEALQTKNIAAKDEGGAALRNSPLAFALINYAKFCLFGDEIYRENALAFVRGDFKKIKIDMSKSAARTLAYLAEISGISLQNLDVLKTLALASEAKNLIDFIFLLESLDEPSAQKGSGGVKVMTVHKSKGLEFEHVVLCDRIGRGKNDTGNFICEYDALNDEYEIKSKITNREFFDADYKRLKDRSTKLDKEEEINKLYVAATRAKSSLIIVKKSGKLDGNNPSYFSKFTSGGDEICYLDLECGETGELKFTPKNTPQTPKFKAKIELASVERERSLSAQKDSEKNMRAIYFGLALHYLLEMSEKFSQSDVKKAEIFMRNKFAKFLDEDDLDDILRRALRLVSDAKFLELTSGATLKKEQALNYEGELKQIDLLCEREGKIVVIDYKSSKSAVEKNVEQVREYVRIIGGIYPNFSVSGAIFYILRDEIEVLEIFKDDLN